MPQETLIPIRFNFFSLTFAPLKQYSATHDSISIMRNVMEFLIDELKKGNGYLIDKHRGRAKGERRELFLTSARQFPKDKRIRCSIGLIRSGKKPMIKPKDTYKLVPISDTDIGSIAEQTHFYIDYSGSTSVLCIEYNHYGPRFNDIEYYFRHIANDILRLVKATTLTLFMDDTLDDTIKNLKEVLSFDVKMRPKSIIQMDKDLVGSYFSGITQLGNKVKPNFIKLKAYFQTPGKIFESDEINRGAKNMIVSLLQRFKSAPYNKDCFEKFEVKFNDMEGEEQTFTLLNGKKEVILEVTDSQLNTKGLYDLITPHFDEFLLEIRK